jgi:hypothetical protein
MRRPVRHNPKRVRANFLAESLAAAGLGRFTMGTTKMSMSVEAFRTGVLVYQPAEIRFTPPGASERGPDSAISTERRQGGHVPEQDSPPYQRGFPRSTRNGLGIGCNRS